MTKDLIEVLYKKVSAEPGSPLFLSLAEELHKQDRMEEAIDVLTAGLRHNPNFTAARLKLAQWYGDTGMHEEALREIEKILVDHGANLYARRLAFRLTRDSGNTEAAEMHAKEILSLRPYDKEALSFVQGMEGSKESIEKVTKQQDPLVEKTIPEDKSSLSICQPTSSEEVQRDIRQVALLTREGRFKEALMMCNIVLASHPMERKVLQMKEELGSLLRILQRKRDRVIERLKRLQGALNRVVFRVQ
jgi:tetratricopeptide (TPR) repeat protein